MNFIPNFFGPNVVVNPPIVNPPIIHRRVQEFHRVFVTEQPHIIENITNIHNHHILRHTCCERPLCCEFNDFCEQNCCGIPLPGPVCPGIDPRF